MKLLILILLFLSHLTMAEKAPKSVLAIVADLEKWGSHPVLIAAAKEQNKKGMSLDSIKKRDKEWRGVDGLDAQMKALIDNPAAKVMLKMEKKLVICLRVS